MNNKLINYPKKNIFMSIISFTEKNQEKKIGISIPGSGSKWSGSNITIQIYIEGGGDKYALQV